MNSQMEVYIGAVSMKLEMCTWMRSGSPTWKLSKPHPFGDLWRLHYTDTKSLAVGD